MKTLLFLRHGKSAWDAEYDHDHERPLARRGIKAAKKMGRVLASADATPDLALSSDAVRASSTYDLAASAGGWDCPCRKTEDLYGASSNDVLRQIRSQPDSAKQLLLVGHEPTWSETVSLLTGGSHVRFPTAAVARIDVSVDAWKDVSFGIGTLVWLIPPKSVPDA